MSEEIIIDGVNVAGCCCYENDKCLWTKRYYENNIVPDCEKVKNCYYKQLKRLQAENELLKDANAHLKTELKQRYDEPDFKSFRLMGKTIDEWKQLETENDLLNEKAKTLDKMTGIYSARLCKKYKQALEEIRGILCKGRTFYDGYFENENLSKTDKVIKVISEVLDERN